jgi:hypothetical protein
MRAGADRRQLPSVTCFLADFAAADQAGLVRIIKRKLKKIKCPAHLIDGYLAGAGLKIEPGDHVHYEFNLARHQVAVPLRWTLVPSPRCAGSQSWVFRAALPAMRPART